MDYVPWFAHQTAQEYEKQKNRVKPLSPEAEAVIRNGKWYFTAFLVQCCNENPFVRGDKLDFST